MGIRKTDPYLYFPMTYILDIINTDKTCFIKINVESSPQEIWLKIRFLEKKRIPITANNPP